MVLLCVVAVAQTPAGPGDQSDAKRLCPPQGANPAAVAAKITFMQGRLSVIKNELCAWIDSLQAQSEFLEPRLLPELIATKQALCEATVWVDKNNGKQPGVRAGYSVPWEKALGLPMSLWCNNGTSTKDPVAVHEAFHLGNVVAWSRSGFDDNTIQNLVCQARNMREEFYALQAEKRFIEYRRENNAAYSAVPAGGGDSDYCWDLVSGLGGGINSYLTKIMDLREDLTSRRASASANDRAEIDSALSSMNLSEFLLERLESQVTMCLQANNCGF